MLWFGCFLSGYVVLFHFYYAIGLIGLAGLGLWAGCNFPIIVGWVMIAFVSIGISFWITKHKIRLFYLVQKYGQVLSPILHLESKHLSRKEFFCR